MSKNKLNNPKEIKMINIILGLSITNLVLTIIFITYLIKEIKQGNYCIHNNIGDLIWCAICIVLNIIASIIILAYNWKSKWAIENKLLWGLLSLFILSFIWQLVFSAVAKQEFWKTNIPDNKPQNNENNSKEN